MLVLSRHQGQKVVFPGLGISIEILQSNGTGAKLGITAPVGIEVHSEEVQERKTACVAELPGTVIPVSERHRRHELRKKLYDLTLKLQLLQWQLDQPAVLEPDDRLEDFCYQLSGALSRTCVGEVFTASQDP